MTVDLIHPPIDKPVMPSQQVGPSADYRDDTARLFDALFAFPSDRLAVAQQIVRSISQQAETALQNSDATKRLDTLRARLASTTCRVDQNAGQHAQAEKDHFDSLSGDSDDAVAESRARVLELAAQLDILRRECDAITKLIADAVASRDEARADAIESARAEVVAQSIADRDAAFQRLLAVVSSDQFRRDVETLASRHLVASAMRSEQHYRRNVGTFMSSGCFMP